MQRHFVVILVTIGSLTGMGACKSAGSRSHLSDVHDSYEATDRIRFASRLGMVGNDVEFTTRVLSDGQVVDSFVGRMPLEEYRCKLIATEETQEARETLLSYLAADRRLDLEYSRPVEGSDEAGDSDRVFRASTTSAPGSETERKISADLAKRMSHINHVPFVKYASGRIPKLIRVPTCADGKAEQELFAKAHLAGRDPNSICCP